MTRRPDLTRLAKLARLADMKAQAGRSALAVAARGEATARAAVAEIDARRAAALIALGAEAPQDTATLRATTAWLRWAEGEQRRLSMELARRRATTLEAQKGAARSIARHAVLEKLSKSR